MRRLVLTFLVMGFSCTIGQVLLVREFMAIYSGNELIVGIIFFNWLLCMAIGSHGLGRLLDRPNVRPQWLAFTLVLTSLILPLHILFVRSMPGWFGAEKGEMVGLLSSLSSTFLGLFPFCSLYGYQFTLCCKLGSIGGAPGEPSIQISRVYVLEALGSVIGGVGVTYLLAYYLHALEISVGLSLLNLSIALLLLHSGETRATPSLSIRLLAAVTVLLIVSGGYAMLSGGIKGLDAASYRWQWGTLQVVDYQNSIYGSIAITKSDGQLDFWVNRLLFFTTPNPDVEFVEEVVHFPMLQHPSPERVLLIGGGLGGVLEELLKHRVRRVTYVELDPLVIELTRRISQASSAVLEDPRVEVVHIDGRLFVKEAQRPFDVAIVNLPSPSTLQLNRFYTMEFFMDVREMLEEDGVFSIGLSSSLVHVSDEMRDRNKCIYETIGRVFASCVVVPGDLTIFLASPSERAGVLTADANVLCQRLRSRGLETRLFTESYIRYRLSPDRVAMGLAYLHENRAEMNLDMRPVAVYYELALWNAMFYPQARTLFSQVPHLELWCAVVPLALVVLALVAVRRRRLVWTPIYLTVFTTGLAGMTFNMIVLYAFQALCGYLYHELGVVAAAFMLGLALGGWFMSRRISERGGNLSTLCSAELFVITYSLLLPVAITLSSLHTIDPLILPTVRGILPLLNCGAGFLVGMEFSLASSICSRGSNRIGRVAGALYASDLLGACSGSLISSIWLIPLQGVLGACLAVAAFKVASLILLCALVRRD